MYSPLVADAEATQLRYRNDTQKVSHHPLLCRTRYAPEEVRQSYVAERGALGIFDAKEKGDATSPVPTPARSPSAPLAQHANTHLTSNHYSRSTSPAKPWVEAEDTVTPVTENSKRKKREIHTREGCLGHTKC